MVIVSQSRNDRETVQFVLESADLREIPFMRSVRMARLLAVRHEAGAGQGGQIAIWDLERRSAFSTPRELRRWLSVPTAAGLPWPQGRLGAPLRSGHRQKKPARRFMVMEQPGTYFSCLSFKWPGAGEQAGRGGPRQRPDRQIVELEPAES